MAARSRKRTNDPVGLRNRVIDAATSAFQAGGYTATSVNDILKAAGVSGGALHHHFPTKKDIIAAVLVERIAVEVDDTWARTVRDAPNAVAGILTVFETIADALDRQGSVSGCPLGNFALELALVDDELRLAVEFEYAKWRAAIADKLVADGNLSLDPAELALTTVALATGAMSLAKVEQSGAPLRRCGRVLQTLLAPRL